MDVLAKELKTLTENPDYSDRYHLINAIIGRLTNGSDYSEQQLIEDLTGANLQFFAKKVASGYYGRD